jgi:hypothetical protein
MKSPTEPAALHDEGLRWILGGLVASALDVAARTGLAEQLAEPRTVAEVAAATGSDPAALVRVLRLLLGAGFLRATDDGRFATTELGATLRRDGALWGAARFYAAPELRASIADLATSVTTGGSAFERIHGTPLYRHLQDEPELGGFFARAMGTQSALHADALLAAYDFAPYRRLVDVGGGDGTTLGAILRAHPRLRGVLLDLPQVVAGVRGLGDRAEVLGGDMLAEVPPDGDCYLLKRVLCDLDDEQAVAVLARCAEAGAAGARIVVVDQEADGGPLSVNQLLDVLFLVVFGDGRVRTRAELTELVSRAGLTVAAERPVPPNVLVEATAAS